MHRFTGRFGLTVASVVTASMVGVVSAHAVATNEEVPESSEELMVAPHEVPDSSEELMVAPQDVPESSEELVVAPHEGSESSEELVVAPQEPLETPPGVDVSIHDVAPDSYLVTTEIDQGVDANAVSTVSIQADTIEKIDVTMDIDGQPVTDSFELISIAPLSDEYQAVTLRSLTTGEEVTVDPSMVQAQAFPVLYLLGMVAARGIGFAIKWFGKAAVKKATKSYLLNNINANKWRHIMHPKHQWQNVGARSKEQVAELMGRAMAEGRHGPYKSVKSAVWKHKGRTIEVTYGKDGKISNGWVRP